LETTTTKKRNNYMSSWSSLKAITRSVSLIARVPGWLLRWNINRSMAKKTFEKELLAAGISPKDARELRELYPFNMQDMIETARSIK